MSTLREKPAEYRGHVSHGVVVLESQVKVPEGMEARVRFVKTRRKKHKTRKLPPSLYERLEPFVGKAKGLPPDASVNLDHYLYGLPKRK